MKRLRRLNVEFSVDDDGALRVPASHPEVGDLTASFGDSEITICIGAITHCHFTPGACGDLKSADPIEEAVTEAGTYVREVLDDEWILWGNDIGFGGSHRVEKRESSYPDDARHYRWSGPVD